MSSTKRKPKKNSNVIKLSRAARFNSTLIIFFIILVYVVASVIKSISKEPITTYKVSSSNINNNIKCTGIALRNENMVNTNKSGYLIYFVRDGDKIKKGALPILLGNIKEIDKITTDKRVCAVYFRNAF